MIADVLAVVDAGAVGAAATFRSGAFVPSFVFGTLCSDSSRAVDEVRCAVVD